MKIAGIIAEYNPFHKGHAYQIAEVRKRTGADYIIAAVSGDFVQRGTPAVMDKYARTRMALSAGVDLVVELPVLWAAASAEYFAAAGVTLFDKMGCVDYLCFGAETDNLSLLSSVAEILAEEPEAYRTRLSAHLKNGIAFPIARELALTEYCSRTGSGESFMPSAIKELLSSPNNILALEYLKALRRRNSPLTPLLIKREGAGYHEEAIDAKNASASAIRRLLSSEENDKKADAGIYSPSVLADALPESSYQIIRSYQKQAAFLCADDFSGLLGYQLLCLSKNEIAETADCNQEIANRIAHCRFSFRSFTQFCGLIKSRDVTYTRMSRILLHLILQHTKEDYVNGLLADYIPYLRILGFCQVSAPLLSQLKKSAEIPLISKLAAAKKLLPEKAFFLLEKDIFAADLYEQVKYITGTKNTALSILPEDTGNEYTRSLVLLPAVLSDGTDGCR